MILALFLYIFKFKVCEKSYISGIKSIQASSGNLILLDKKERILLSFR